MGIDDDIGDNARGRLRHVLGIQNHAHCALLTVSRTEFIAYLWYTILTHPNFGKGISLAVPVLIDLVHVAALVITRRLGHIPTRLGACRKHLARGNTQRDDLANEHIVGSHELVLRNETISTQLVVVGILHVFRDRNIRATESLLLPRTLVLLLFVLIGPVEDRTEPTPVQRTPVNHIGILLVVARIGHDGHDHVGAGGQLLGPVELAHEGADHGNLGIT